MRQVAKLVRASRRITLGQHDVVLDSRDGHRSHGAPLLFLLLSGRVSLLIKRQSGGEGWHAAEEYLVAEAGQTFSARELAPLCGGVGDAGQWGGLRFRTVLRAWVQARKAAFRVFTHAQVSKPHSGRAFGGGHSSTVCLCVCARARERDRHCIHSFIPLYVAL